MKVPSGYSWNATFNFMQNPIKIDRNEKNVDHNYSANLAFGLYPGAIPTGNGT